MNNLEKLATEIRSISGTTEKQAAKKWELMKAFFAAGGTMADIRKIYVAQDAA